jgi:hypothetical protein
MKDIVKQVQSFLSFDRPFEIEAISSTFSMTHNQQQKIIPGWGTDSTRQILISTFWFNHVIRHFSAILGLAIVLTCIATESFNKYMVLAILIFGLFSFLVLLFFIYLPNFTADFLPKLEAVKNGYVVRQQEIIIKQLRDQLSAQQQSFQAALQQELADQGGRILKNQERVQRKIQDQVAGQKELVKEQQEAIKKCRQTQLSNFALTLVYYVLAELAGIKSVDSTEETAHLLQKLYGVDPGSIRANLELICGTGSKRKGLTERKITETRNRFAEATQFFKEMKCADGIKILNRLEMNILGN